MMADQAARRALPIEVQREIPIPRSITNHPEKGPRPLPDDFRSFLEKRGVNVERVIRNADNSLGPQDAALIDLSQFEEFPNIEVTPTTVYPFGRTKEIPRRNFEQELATRHLESVPILVGRESKQGLYDFDVISVRNSLMTCYKDIFKDVTSVEDFHRIPNELINCQIARRTAEVLNDIDLRLGVDFLPTVSTYHEALSPIGIAHFYRQIFFNLGEGVGPIEQAFTIVPLETLEVVYETIRHQIHEKFVEMGSEIISETASESKNLDEISDKVSSIVQRDTSAAMSAQATFSASGGVGVWQASGSGTIGADATIAQSSQRSTEFASRRLKESNGLALRLMLI